VEGDPDTFHGLLAISQPHTSGQAPLPGTIAEVQAIQLQIEESNFTWLNDSKATKDAVLEEMQTHSWIHLACHGEQHAGDPMKSAFMLHDGPLDMRAISQKSFPRARLAFLSACQTAAGDEHLPEEAAHLAAGMLMAGYRTVIGTMWSIRDRDAPIVAEEVYNYLKEEKKVERGQAAYALHRAVERLRENVGENNFLSWMPFIHLGI
jgi:CHAT domain-containing protein